MIILRLVAATGGTFDILHRGHKVLLSAALQYDDTIIGLCSDEFVFRRGKYITHKYDVRLQNLTSFIQYKFPDVQYTILQLDDDFGPAVLKSSVNVLVCSEETAHMGDILNNMRLERQLPAVEIVVVPMVRGSDGTRISTSRIRDKIIDKDGNKILSCG